jgi:HK97 family phage major capsid protein
VSGTAGDRPMHFGNFRAGFVTRTVTGGMLKRLEERYADFLQVGFFAFSRHDSVVQDASAIKYLEIVA